MSTSSVDPTTTTAYNLGPLITTYSPSGASCSTIYQRLENGGLEYGTVNTPEATSKCLPTNYTPDGGFYYSPGVCPLGYTIACTAAIAGGSDGTATAATCCPNGGYSCRETRVPADPVACESSISEYLTLYLEAYSTISDSISSTSVTTVVSPGNVVFAEAVVVRRGAGDPTWSGVSTTSSMVSSAGSSTAASTTSPTGGESGTGSTESNPTSSLVPGELSSSAKIGIGIGVGLGVLVILSATVAGFQIMKRRRQRAYLEKIERQPKGHDNPYQRPQEITGSTGQHELSGPVRPHVELDGRDLVAEIHTDSPPAELMEYSHWNK